MQQLTQVQIQFHLLTAFGPAFSEKVEIVHFIACGIFVTTLISKEGIDVNLSEIITNYRYSNHRIKH